MILSHSIIDLIQRELNGGTNKCYNCGEIGHYVLKGEVWGCQKNSKVKGDVVCTKTCQKETKILYAMNRSGHTNSQCYAKTRIVDEDSD